MKILQKILGIILDIIIFIVSIIVVIAIIYVVQTKLLKKEYADIFGYTAFEVVTGSMSGTIEIGDLEIVKITDNIDVNDIIVYKDGSSFITHRIVEIRGTQVITKGDANNSQDMPIEKSQIFGKVVSVIPKIGIWQKVLTTPSVLFAIVFTTIVIGAVVYYKPHKKIK